ncbi:MAG: hypothetical protein EZS28_039802, partial [Streblomastix strix]
LQTTSCRDSELFDCLLTLPILKGSKSSADEEHEAPMIKEREADDS